MADEQRFNEVDETRELERVLSAFKLRPTQIDRDRFLFLAGRASAEAGLPTGIRRWRWPAATLISSTTAIALLVVLVIRPDVTRMRADVAVAEHVPPVANAAPYVDRAAPVESVAGDRSSTNETAASNQADLDVLEAANQPRLRIVMAARADDSTTEPSHSSDAPPLELSTPQEPPTQRQLLQDLLKGRST